MKTARNYWLCTIALLLGMTTTSSAAPIDSPHPGGITVLQIPQTSDSTAPAPVVSANGKRALLLDTESGWLAIVAIPLDQQPGEMAVTVDYGDGSTTVQKITIKPHSYREQRITVSNQSYVSPDEGQLQRIAAERKIIDSALDNWREQPLQSITLAVPVTGPRSSSFGLRRFFNDQPRSPHKGMDIAAETGTAIKAPAAGIVTAAGDYFFNGNTVIIDHGQGLVTLYCHLSKIDVDVSDVLVAGQVLGEVGATGRVTGPHLHFATYLSATAVDPALFFVEESGAP